MTDTDSSRTEVTVTVAAPAPVVPRRPVVDQTALAEARRAQLRAELVASEYDVLVLLERESVHYATGYRSVGADLYGTHRMAALLTADDCWLVCPTADAPAAMDVGFPLERIVPFGTFFFESVTDSPLSLTVGRHPSLESALRVVVGTLGARLSYGVESPVEGFALGDGVRLSDATAHVRRARASKLPAEVEILRYAAQLAEAGVATAVAAAGSGATEKEIAGQVAAVMVAGGGTPRFVVVGSGERSALSDSFASDRAWGRGEVLRFDTGCVVDGYWSDIGRTAVLGEPSHVQTVRYSALLAGQEASFELARPGVTGRELFEAAVRTVNGHGLPYRRQHCGHGIGLSIYEAPAVSPAGDTAIEAGTTMCLETPFYELGWAGMMVEDTVVITPGGYERLTCTDRGLWVVSA